MSVDGVGVNMECHATFGHFNEASKVGFNFFNRRDFFDSFSLTNCFGLEEH